jgi:YD repeat-containing protein
MEGVPAPTNDSLMRAMSKTEYDARGRVFRATAFEVDQAKGAERDSEGYNKLVTGYWYDQRDNLVKTLNPGGLVDKSQYDRADRPIARSLTDGGGDDPTGEDDTWAHAMGLGGDIIIERVETQYDKNGNPIFLTTSQRLPEGGMRTSYAGNYYDLADRLTDTVDWGTSGGGRPAQPPARSDDVLVNTYFYYDAGGHVWQSWDARGIVTMSRHDAAGRVTAREENYGAGPGNERRVTRYEYDGLDRPLLVTVSNALPTGQIKPQATRWVYGTGACVEGSAIISADLLGKIVHPNGAQERYAYNALGQPIRKLDGTGALHAYEYDAQGSLESDALRMLPAGSGIDTQVTQLTWYHDIFGRVTMAASKRNGAWVNSVWRV